MADAVAIKWIYPANWDGNPPSSGGWNRVKVQLTCLSDGTGETNVKKVDISEFRTTEGIAPIGTIIDRIEYDVSGFNVLLEWDRAPAAEITRLIGAPSGISGVIGYSLVDPSDGTDGTGDILITTTGATSGDGYRILLHMRFK